MAPQVLVPFEEFAHDLDVNLGRANGNVFHRKPGVEFIQDGQIMVRLKKKRFIIIDYSIEPNEEDIQIAQSHPNIKIFDGAGKRKCTMSNCNKIGVPVCLWDSEPDETDSLYLRSGMCFTCQRNLNEKRRTERKRTTKPTNETSAGSCGEPGSSPSLIYAIGPNSHKKFKLNGSTIQLNNDAIIINGGSCLEGVVKDVVGGEGYALQDISHDLQTLAREATADVDRLIDAVSGGSATEAAAAAVAAVGDAGSASLSAEAAANAVVAAASSGGCLGLEESGRDESLSSSSPSINDLYEKAFKTMNKAIYLLHQWKTSWDAAVETVADPNFADAVASAAAVVAAAADTGSDQGNNMVSLLLAADKRKENKDGGVEHLQHHDEQHHDEVMQV